jgi:transposase
MKTQMRMPVSGKAKYSTEYKQQALELWRKSGRSAAKVAAELGIRPELLYKWSTNARQAHEGQAARGARSLAELESENQRLREENAKLFEQREVLKKSLGILSEPPLRGMPGSNR